MATASELSAVRKMGFKKKKPKKPRQSAPLSVWERYDQRVNDFNKEVKEVLQKAKKKEALLKKHA